MKIFTKTLWKLSENFEKIFYVDFEETVRYNGENLNLVQTLEKFLENFENLFFETWKIIELWRDWWVSKFMRFLRKFVKILKILQRTCGEN